VDSRTTLIHPREQTTNAESYGDLRRAFAATCNKMSGAYGERSADHSSRDRLKRAAAGASALAPTDDYKRGGGRGTDCPGEGFERFLREGWKPEGESGISPAGSYDFGTRLAQR